VKLLSKEQENEIADQILKQARDDNLTQQASAFRPTLPLYRCSELRALAPWMQPLVVRHASQAVTKSPVFILTVIAWLGGMFALWSYQYGEARFILACSFVPLLLRGMFVRHEVKKIAAQLQLST
jgi:hypothetical protein